jgi:SAM-dependent methyltransferase
MARRAIPTPDGPPTVPDLACLGCLGPLDLGPDAWRCDSCEASGRCLRGIPDLRTCEDLYLANAEDWAFALKLDAAFDRLDFRGLLDLYFDLSSEVAPDQRARQIGHILSAPWRVVHWVDALGTNLPQGPWIDLGCGSGSFIAAVGRERAMVGLDVAMRWLLVARKRLDEEGLPQIRLVCGNAERMPFRDESFAAVVAGDVVEHVADQAATLAESRRVLMPGGRLFLASPNRFSLAPEPHVGVWGVGFLPRPWMGPYVRLVRHRDFRAIRTLSYAEWTRLVGRSPFGGASIICPSLPLADLGGMPPLKRGLARAYNRLVRWPMGQRLMHALGPLFHVVATRTDSTPTTPPPRPQTRP